MLQTKTLSSEYEHIQRLKDGPDEKWDYKKEPSGNFGTKRHDIENETFTTLQRLQKKGLVKI